MNTAQALQYARTQLATCSASAALDAEVLLAYVLQVARSHLFAHPEQNLTPLQQQNFMDLLAQRHQQKPLAYLVGEREFWSLDLMVNEHVLIPRPETELLVELTLVKLATIKHAKIVDLGTGSGAVAIALAHERADWKIIAVDNNEQALAITQANVKRYHLENVAVLKSDWCQGLPNKDYLAIVGNPPYIADNDPRLQNTEIRYEPRYAQIAGDDGLAAIRIIVDQAWGRLQDQGWLLLEHGYQQGNKVRALYQQAGFSMVTTQQDLAGLDRVTIGKKMTKKP